MRPRRRGAAPAVAPALAVAVAFSVAGTHRAAADPVMPAGVWELSLEGSHRKCRLTLGLEPAGNRHAIRFPLGCRRALPVLATAVSWGLDEARIRVFDTGGQPLLTLRPSAEGGLFTAESEGRIYRLERQDHAAAAVPRPALSAPLPPPSAPPPTPMVDPATAPAPETLPGLYAVDRGLERDLCRLALAPTPASGSGPFELRVEENCRDRGLAVFDPVAWRYQAGRLILTARRGFDATLVADRPEHWRRHPEVGAPLILRKLP